MPEKLKTGNTEEMLENISEDTEKESGTEISETTENTSDAQTQNMSWKIRDMSIPPTAISVS